MLIVSVLVASIVQPDRVFEVDSPIGTAFEVDSLVENLLLTLFVAETFYLPLAAVLASVD